MFYKGSWSRLWQYLNVYFLKPFDALNDTVASDILLRLEWPDELIELGAGDGLFSFILHGGKLPLGFDRYLQVDLNEVNIYGNHTAGLFPAVSPPSVPRVLASIDASQTHTGKVAELGYSSNTLCALYEALPLSDDSTQSIFYYIPHGLKDHSRAIQEAHRVLAPGGKMLILLYDSSVSDSFSCYNIAQSLRGPLHNFFLRLDNGRHDELTNLARTKSEWISYFVEQGFFVEGVHAGLSPMAWRLYDVQTRPLLKPLIRFFNILPPCTRKVAKLIWMSAWYPLLISCLALFGARSADGNQRTCFLAFQLRTDRGVAFEPTRQD